MFAADDEEECCVCFMHTQNKTPCGHLLCKQCWLLLSEPACPICRQQISIIKMRRLVHGIKSISDEFAPSMSMIQAAQDTPSLPTLARRPSTAGSSHRSHSLSSLHQTRRQGFRESRLQNMTVSTMRSVGNHTSTNSPRSPLSPLSPPILPSLPRDLRSSDTDPVLIPNIFGNRRISEVQGSISRMTLQDMLQFWQRFQGLAAQNSLTSSDSDLLQKSLSKRMSILIGLASLNALSGIVNVLQSFRDLQINLEGEGGPLHALEARFSYFVKQSSCSGDRSREIESLAKCLPVAVTLASQDWQLPRYQLMVIDHIAKWFEVAPLRICCNYASTLASLARGEARIFEALMQQLVCQAKRKLSPVHLQAFASFLCSLSNSGLPVWSEDLEAAIAHNLQSSISAWSDERLQDEIHSEGLVHLCEINANIGRIVRAAFSKCVTKQARSIGLKLKSTQKLEDATAALREWSRLVQRAHTVRMLAFDAVMRRAILDAFCDCEEICMVPGSPCSECLEEVQRMQWNVMLLVGDNGVLSQDS